MPIEYGTDKWTAGIELSNACRNFYKSRLQAAQEAKQTWLHDLDVPSLPSNLRSYNEPEPDTGLRPLAKTVNYTRKRTSVDVAVDRLKKEMVRICASVYARSYDMCLRIYTHTHTILYLISTFNLNSFKVDVYNLILFKFDF